MSVQYTVERSKPPPRGRSCAGRGSWRGRSAAGSGSTAVLATAVLVTDVATPEDAITVAGAITPEVLPHPVALGPVLPPVFTAPEPAPVPPVPTAAPLTTAAGAG